MKRSNLLIVFISISAILIFIISCQKRDFKSVAKVETEKVSEIMATTVKANGNIIDLGTGITDYGHCWSLLQNPTITNSKTSLGSVEKKGTYTSELKNLEPGKTYYIKSYVKSGGEILYSKNSLSFTTPGNPLYVKATIGNATPSILEMTYDLTLSDIVIASSAFTVLVNSVSRSVDTVSISGTKVSLTLATPVVYGDVVTVAYTKPATNPLQTPSGGQAATISAQAVTNIVNPINPVYVSSVIGNAAPSILEMTYNLTLANIVPAASAFTVQVNSVSRTVNNVAISGTKVQLTLASPVVYGDVVTVAYTKPATNPLQTASGGQAVTIIAQSVTNNVNPINPVYTSSAIGNATPSILEMTYNLTLANIVPANSAFTVQVNSASRTVNSVSISGTNVQLTLASAVNYGDVVTVSYAKPAINPLQTAAGGMAASITAQPVINNLNQFNIGDSYQGGIIAYILQPGDPGYIAGETHGLIAAPSDQSTGIQWYNGIYIITGATETALGTGLANTNKIISAQGPVATNYAAGLARAYNGGGYNDWYLPSLDELNKLYLNKVVVCGFANNYYWTSSEDYSSYNAWTQSFNGGTQYYIAKYNVSLYVRAIRAF